MRGTISFFLEFSFPKSLIQIGVHRLCGVDTVRDGIEALRHAGDDERADITSQFAP